MVLRKESLLWGFLFFSFRPLVAFGFVFFFFDSSRLFDTLFMGQWILLYKFSLFLTLSHLLQFFFLIFFFSSFLLWIARNSDSKLTWSPGSVTNTSLAHELWKVPLPPKNITAPSRPPPGLTGQKPPLSTWDNSPLRVGGGWGNSDARYTPGRTRLLWCLVTSCLLTDGSASPVSGETAPWEGGMNWERLSSSLPRLQFSWGVLTSFLQNVYPNLYGDTCLKS